jgi:HAD superfamily hydrolase (TIGR01509 family)
MAIKAVILDMDGTVVEFRYNAGKAKKDLRSFIVLQGIPDDMFYEDEPLALNVDRIMKYLLERNEMSKVEALRDGVEKITTKYEMAAARSTEVLDGAKDALKRLCDKGYKVAVFTNSGRKALETVMKRLELGNCFELILTRDEVVRMKPHPDGLEKALELLKVTPDEAVFVGDGVIDMMAAVKAGVHPIGVVSGAKGEKELREAGAAHVIHSIKYLPGLLSKFPGNRASGTRKNLA